MCAPHLQGPEDEGRMINTEQEMLSVLLVIAVLLLLLVIYLFDLQRKYSYFSRRSIPTPRWEFFFGHYRTLWSAESISRQWESWTKQFGSLYGLYEGTRPVYVCSDVDFLEEVFIKQFSSFHSRRLPFVTRLSIGEHVHLFGADGQRWRRQRSIINPTFSTHKLHSMSPLIDQSIEMFMTKLVDGQSMNIYPLFKQLTMDVICRCAFGIGTDVQMNADNPFLIQSEKFFRDNHEKIFVVQLSYLMPFLVPLLTQWIRLQMLIFFVVNSIFPSRLEEAPGFWLINQVKHSIAQRMNNEQPSRLDLLQLMINVGTSNTAEIHADGSTKKLHFDEISSNVFLFMIAGFETTSTTLACATYVLATHPHIQEKLYEQISQPIDQFEYLDMFLREVLRMYPVAVQAISRECNETTFVCGQQIDRGAVIQPDVFSLHYSEELWGPEDPHVFSPERHSVPRHPMALMAFGQGPRNCIGMRFALLELKVALVRLLRDYRIFPTEETEKKFLRRETLVIQPDAVLIRLEKRH